MRTRLLQMIMAAAVILAPATLSLAANPPHRGMFRNRFAHQHPRRAEVDHRLADQQHRIHEGLKTGKLTPAQAKQLEANDQAIKQQERADVKANGGFLTKAEKRQLNQEENANSTLIRDDKHPAPK